MTEVKLHECDDELLEKVLALREAVNLSYYPDDIHPPRDVQRKGLRTPPRPTSVVRTLLAMDDDAVVGEGLCYYQNPEVPTNPDFMEFHIKVHPDRTGEGIAKELLWHSVRVATEEGKTKVECFLRPDVMDGRAQRWVKKMGGKHTLTEVSNRLNRERVNFNFINEVLSKDFEYRLVSYSKDEYNERVLTDDAFATEAADFYTEVGNLVPRGDSSAEDHVTTMKDLRISAEASRKNPYDSYLLYCMDGDRIVGYSGTYFAKTDPVLMVGTGLTGVRKAYQRRGIATRLKAQITKDLLEKFPDLRYIETENADYNTGMLTINTHLGYREAHRWESYELDLDSVRKYVEGGN